MEENINTTVDFGTNVPAIDVPDFTGVDAGLSTGAKVGIGAGIGVALGVIGKTVFDKIRAKRKGKKFTDVTNRVRDRFKRNKDDDYVDDFDPDADIVDIEE